jgi:hypothetical protein
MKSIIKISQIDANYAQPRNACQLSNSTQRQPTFAYKRVVCFFICTSTTTTYDDDDA